MILQSLTLLNFRNFEKRQFEFSSGTTVIVGANAVGKTNILEGIYALATGKSFKAKIEEEMINYNAEIGRISASVASSKQQVVSEERMRTTSYNLHSTDLEIVLTRGEITIGVDPKKVERAPRKKLLVNGVSKRLIDFAGNLTVVSFAPQDMDLVTESPAIRRKFLDSVLSQVDREYPRALVLYEKGLRQRNKLLFRIREEGVPRSQLLFWNTLLIKNGNYLTQKRSEFVNFINSYTSPLASDYEVEYDASIISESRLDQYKVEEVASATTLVGPHRDDFVFKIRNSKFEIRNSSARDLSRFGSRGEQRMGVLWLKLAELAFIEEIKGESPVLLLDDIFSELDHKHRDLVFKMTEGRQTLFTTADPHFVENIKDGNVIEI